MKINLALNSGFEFTTVKTVEVDRATFEWAVENLNFAIDSGVSAQFAARQSADVLARHSHAMVERIKVRANEDFAASELATPTPLPSPEEFDALVMLADLTAAFAGHHSAIVDFRPNL